MSGLQEFLTPFSHLIFANRDKVIVLLAALLAWFTIQLLIPRWRNQRLERALSAAPVALGLPGRGRAADAGGATRPGPVLPAATSASHGSASSATTIRARPVWAAPAVRTTFIPLGLQRTCHAGSARRPTRSEHAGRSTSLRQSTRGRAREW